MKDIVERLRAFAGDPIIGGIVDDAADEVESLRKRLFEMQNAAIDLTKQLAEAQTDRDDWKGAAKASDKIAADNFQRWLLSQKQLAECQAALALKDAALMESLAYYERMFGVCVDSRNVTHHETSIKCFGPSGAVRQAIAIKPDNTSAIRNRHGIE